MAEQTVREAVGVFHDEKSLQSAVDEMLVAGFDRSSMTLLASEQAVSEKLGHRYRKIDEIEDDLTVPRIAYVGSDSRIEGEAVAVSGLAYVGALSALGAIVASGGTVAAAIIGAAAAGGMGGLIGSTLSRFLAQHHADRLREHLDHGGLLLWVSTHDEAQEKKACDVLRKSGAEHVHAHDLPHPDYALKGGLSYDLSFMNRLGL